MVGRNAQPAIPAPMTTEQLRRAAQAALGIDTVNYYNIAFAGDCNNGKSTLINSLRRIKKGCAGYAETGAMETTMKPAAYRFPADTHFKAFEHAVLWDIPGANTKSHPAASYIESMKLYAYDFVVILTGGSLTENDIMFAEAVAHYGVPFCFARSKCDQALKDDYEAEYDKEEDIREVDKQTFKAKGEQIYRKYIAQRPTLKDCKVYFVSSRVVEGRKNFLKYRLDENEMLRDIVYKVMERRNPGAKCVADYLVHIASVLGLTK